MSTTQTRPTIAFDGAVFGAGPITGVAGSFLTTLRAYAASAPARCVLLAPRATHIPDIPMLEVVEGPFGRWPRQRAVPRVLKELGASLLHCPVAALPLASPSPHLQGPITSVHRMRRLGAMLRVTGEK